MPTESAAIKLKIKDKSTLSSMQADRGVTYIDQNYNTYFDFRSNYEVGRIHYQSETTKIVSREFGGRIGIPDVHRLQIIHHL